ncbi:trafficking kinesin-binding protein 1-like isoform X2 [Eriocheir sinensis]|uniref:trafficking kinesin-binding protein 1-like isoform X2 n=1 Tax=Eriocheir sinensis TaxID=95602 RepID=UPI0021C78C06|nr:trafficking kinesin-binding protein 1-like isoform X2 [Eriocheir sinensis]
MATFPSVLVSSSSSIRGGEELEGYSENTPSFTALGNKKGFRERIMPHRRAPSRPQCHAMPQGSSRGPPVGRRLMAECRMMLRKNQSWLSMEDLTTPTTPTTAPGIERSTSPVQTLGRRPVPLLNTIPDTAPVTLTKGFQQEDALDTPVLGLSTSQETLDPVTPTSPSAAPVFFLEPDGDASVYSGSTYTLESSGTLTPSSDATLSRGPSVEMLSPLSPSPAVSISSPRKDSASFAMHRGDSVDGLFMSSSPVSSPPEPQEVAAPPSLARQSPFRRQLFTSLITRQSALVSRVNQHSTTLLEVVGAVKHFTQRETTTTTAHTTSRSPQEAPTAALYPQNPPRPQNMPHPAPQEPEEVGEEALLLGDVEQLHEIAAPLFERAAGRRHLSICDSGLGFDTDDDVPLSLSRSSTYTTSEDGEEIIDMEVLCGNRVSQMTKTYNDIDAVTRLLQEKEKDLELAAKIGQQLLNRNKALEERNSLLDAELSSATEKITQLRHDLQMKTDLLQIYTNDVDESSCETTPTSLRHINVDILQHRVRNLEDENKSLRLEACQIASDTQEIEDKEKELVSDVIKQLSDANIQVSQLSEELAKKVEDSLRQQEEITQLLAQVVDLQSRNKRMVAENDELANMVGVARDCQQELTMELAELKEKYAEVLDLLHDTQDQLRRVQKKNLPGSRGHHLSSGLFSSPFNSGNDSIASELHSLSSLGEEPGKGRRGSHLGVPGWPGTPDLDSCLRRLAPGDRSGTPSQFLPYGCRTPDSIMSTGSGKSGMSAYGGANTNDWKLPQKLQIVKPIEGSLTLHQWSRLATPHLGGLLEEREGVAIKGGTSTGLNLEVYSMSDLEEDEPEEENPGKRFMSTSGVFTYTNSTILHPDDQTTSTPSVRQAQVSVLPTSVAHATPTPSTPIRAPSCPPSRRGSTATFSVNTGLAKVLNERGMNLQSGFSPTATPANSPSASRPGSPEAEGYKLPGLEDLTKTFYYGASLLRRTFYKNDPSAPQSPTGPRVNLVEQVQAMGVDRFVGMSGRALTVGGVVTSRPATSPLLHLSNLIMSSAKTTTSTTSTTAATTTTTSTTNGGAGPRISGVATPPKVMSPGERRPTLPSGAPMGIPGHPGSGHLDNRLTQLKPGQRADLGTVGGRSRPTTLGMVPPRGGSSCDLNVGTVGWTSFGRKGGLL